MAETPKVEVRFGRVNVQGGGLIPRDTLKSLEYKHGPTVPKQESIYKPAEPVSAPQKTGQYTDIPSETEVRFGAETIEPDPFTFVNEKKARKARNFWGRLFGRSGLSRKERKAAKIAAEERKAKAKERAEIEERLAEIRAERQRREAVLEHASGSNPNEIIPGKQVMCSVQGEPGYEQTVVRVAGDGGTDQAEARYAKSLFVSGTCALRPVEERQKLAQRELDKLPAQQEYLVNPNGTPLLTSKERSAALNSASERNNETGRVGVKEPQEQEQERGEVPKFLKDGIAFLERKEQERKQANTPGTPDDSLGDLGRMPTTKELKAEQDLFNLSMAKEGTVVSVYREPE